MGTGGLEPFKNTTTAMMSLAAVDDLEAVLTKSVREQADRVIKATALSLYLLACARVRVFLSVSAAIPTFHSLCACTSFPHYRAPLCSFLCYFGRVCLNKPQVMIDFPKPIICGVNGPAVGFACTTTQLCDVTYCSDTAHFEVP